MIEKLGIYAIYDDESGLYDQPFFAVSDLMATRRFHLMIDENQVFKKWKRSFKLDRLGTVQLDNGSIETDDAKTLVFGNNIKTDED